MIGETISHYKILEKLGEGGMGVVYKAQDTKLDRVVALKFLPERLVRDEEAKSRFVNEAKAASALNHPNITTIYEIDEREDMCFISMEYIKGKSIKDLIEERELSYEEIIKITTQIAEGLNAAHKKDIVHRDIKSDNIMLTEEGQVKIMDFGLAKLTGVSQLTKVGTTLGTMQYMSPEQVQGMEVDHRSDIFSLGVVLYEMVTRELPFKGDYEAAVIYSIINETPEPLTDYRADIPQGLQRIEEKLLEKQRETRYQNVDELLADIERLTKGEEVKPVSPRKINWTFVGIGASTIVSLLLLVLVFSLFKITVRPPEKPTLAVLYLKKLDDKVEDYFAAGMTEAIITDLAQLGGLRVLPRSEVAPFRDRDINIEELSKKLKVDYLIDGSIQKDSNEIRINAFLIKTKDGEQLWAEKFTGDLNDIFEVQDKVAKKIASELQVKLTPAEEERIERKPTENVLAYDHYLRGMDYFWKGSERDLYLALEKFDNALSEDPKYALAYSGKGEVYATLYNYQRTLDWLEKAKESAQKALSIDAELAEAHLTLGRVYDFEKKGELAIEEFEKVIELKPNSYDAYRRLGWVYMYNLFDYSKSIEYFEKALEIRPTDAKSYRGLGLSFTALRRYDKAVGNLKKGLEIVPDDIYLLTFLAEAYRYRKDFNSALEIYQKALRYYPNDPNVSFYIGGWVYYSKKDYDKAIEIFEKSIEQGMPEFRVLVYIATAYRQKGDITKANVFYDSSVSACERILEKEPENFWVFSELGLSYAFLGMKEKAIAVGEQALRSEPSADQMYNLALIYAILRKDISALKSLEQACEKDPSYIDIASMEVEFQHLENKPIFQKLLKKKY